MNKKTSVLFFFVLVTVGRLFGQETDFGIWTDIGIEKKLGKWALESNAQLRLQDDASTVGRVSMDIGASYRIIKPVSVGVAYEYMSFYDSKYDDYQPRQRYIAYVRGKQKIGNFTFSLRERFQRTIKDESNRLLSSGKYDTYKINPEWTWRNRLGVGYNIPGLSVRPSLTFETFYQLNNPDGNRFDKLRYMLSLEYALTKKHSLEVFGLMDREINVKSPLTRYVTGCGYQFSF
ncbi:MAG: DUF2490 domain-containing protein [Breznakibacter sp.]